MSARIAMHQTIRTAGEAVTFFYMQYRMKSRFKRTLYWYYSVQQQYGMIGVQKYEENYKL